MPEPRDAARDDDATPLPAAVLTSGSTGALTPVAELFDDAQALADLRDALTEGALDDANTRLSVARASATRPIAARGLDELARVLDAARAGHLPLAAAELVERTHTLDAVAPTLRDAAALALSARLAEADAPLLLFAVASLSEAPEARARLVDARAAALAPDGAVAEAAHQAINQALRRHLEAQLATDPDDVKTRAALAWTLLDLDATDEARAVVEDGLERAPEATRWRLLSARLALADDPQARARDRAALARLGALHLDLDDLAMLDHVGEAALREGDLETARRALEALAQRERDLGLRRDLEATLAAVDLMRAGRWLDAATWRLCLYRRPLDEVVWASALDVQLADALAEREPLIAAAALTLSDDPERADRLEALRDRVTQTQALTDAGHLDDPAWPRAPDDDDALDEDDLDDDDDGLQEDDLLVKAAREQLARRLRKRAEQRPDDARLQAAAALALGEAVSPYDALGYAQRAVGLAPDAAEAHHALAVTLLDLAWRDPTRVEPAQVARAVDEGLARAPDNAALLTLRAALPCERAASLVAAQRLIERDPGDELARRLAIGHLLHLGRPDALEALLRDTLARADDPEARAELRALLEPATRDAARDLLETFDPWSQARLEMEGPGALGGAGAPPTLRSAPAGGARRPLAPSPSPSRQAPRRPSPLIPRLAFWGVILAILLLWLFAR